jgi:hypothetical protein
MMHGSKHVNWVGYGELPGDKWTTILRQAKGRSIEVKITIQEAWNKFIEQKKLCALSGEPLYFDTPGRKSSGCASLDRIDSSKGYVKGNIQWVHKDVQMMKWKLSQDRFKQLCKKVSNNE